MIENGPGWVRIKHAETQGEAEITQDAWDEPTAATFTSFADRGWQVIETYQDPSTAPQPAVAPRPAPPADTGRDI